jgi:acyl carrier protein
MEAFKPLDPAMPEPAKPVPEPTHPPDGGNLPETDTERALAAIWCELLSIPRVGAHDNFFDLGGNSLLALVMVGRVEAELGRSIPLEKLFEGPPLREIAGWLAAPETGASSGPENT